MLRVRPDLTPIPLAELVIKSPEPLDRLEEQAVAPLSASAKVAAGERELLWTDSPVPQGATERSENPAEVSPRDPTFGAPVEGSPDVIQIHAGPEFALQRLEDERSDDAILQAIEPLAEEFEASPDSSFCSRRGFLGSFGLCRSVSHFQIPRGWIRPMSSPQLPADVEFVGKAEPEPAQGVLPVRESHQASQDDHAFAEELSVTDLMEVDGDESSPVSVEAEPPREVDIASPSDVDELTLEQAYDALWGG